MVKWYRLLATLSLAAVLIIPLLMNSLAAAQEKIEDNYINSPLSAPGDPAVDNSTSPAFPPIGGQGELSSCVSWAATYYQLTYENALARGINVSGGDASNIFSPRWTYNFCNGGGNGDSDPNNTYEVMAKNGAATLAQFPYSGDGSDPASYRAWCLNPAAWRSAIKYRSSWSTITGSGDSFINSLKNEVATGRVLTFCTYVQSWGYLEIGNDPETGEDDALSGQFIATYMSTSQRDYHTMTIVGYNDYIWCDINRNGVVDNGEKGAFKIANSRGTGDWNRGFRWVCYDALRSRSTVSGTDIWPPADRDSRGAFLGKAWKLTVNPDYTPTMVARVTLNHVMRDQLDILLGVGSAGENEPTVTWESAAINTPAGSFAFDGSTTAVDGTFYFDFTDIASRAPANARWFVGVEDGYEDGRPSTIKSFILYRVSGGRDIEVGRNESVQTVDHGRIWVGIDAGAESPTPTTTTPSPTPTSPANGFKLTTKVSGKGTITRDPNQTRYEAGTTVTLTATALGKYKFIRWSGAATGSDNTIQITMDNNKTVTAVFTGSSGGSGGGGGGGAYVPPPADITLGLTGLNSTTSPVTNSLGMVKNNIQLKTPDGKVTLDIPAGTTLKDSSGAALKSISAGIPPTPPAPPQDNAIILDRSLGPEGANFNPPLDLTLQYDPGAIPVRGAEDTLYLAYWDGSKWVTQQSQLDTVKKTITAKITHFSQFAILDKIPPPPKFELSGLRISRLNVRSGEPVEITIATYNSGGSGNYDFILKLNGVEVEKKTVNLAAGAKSEVSFKVNKTEPGTYIFDVNGLSDRFNVVEVKSSATAAPISSSIAAALPEIGTVAALTTAVPNSPATTTAITAASSPEKETIPVQKSYSLPVKWIIIGLAAVMILISVIFATNIRRRM